jgi:hypothetical protein
MLSIRIKEKIEKEFGKGSIKYAKDCDALSQAIAAKCNCKVSSSTLKRLFGINKSGSESPRGFTLDVLANYINYHSWEDLLRDLTQAKKKKIQPVQVLLSRELKRGAKFYISFSPLSYIVIEYISNNRFKLLLQNRTTLLPDDILEIAKVETHVPLFINTILRNDIIHGELFLGRLTGVKEIKKYSNNLKSK